MFTNLMRLNNKRLSTCEPFLQDKHVKIRRHSTIGKRAFVKLIRNKKMTQPKFLHFTGHGALGLQIREESNYGLKVHEEQSESEHFLMADMHCGLVKLSKDPTSCSNQEILALLHYHNGLIFHKNFLYEVNCQKIPTNSLLVPVLETNESSKHSIMQLKSLFSNMREDVYIQADNTIQKLFMSITARYTPDIYLSEGFHYFTFEVLPTTVPIYIYYITQPTSILVPWLNYIEGYENWTIQGDSYNLTPIFREGESSEQLEKLKIVLYSEFPQRVQVRLQHGFDTVTIYKGRERVHSTICKSLFGKIIEK